MAYRDGPENILQLIGNLDAKVSALQKGNKGVKQQNVRVGDQLISEGPTDNTILVTDIDSGASFTLPQAVPPGYEQFVKVVDTQTLGVGRTVYAALTSGNNSIVIGENSLSTLLNANGNAASFNTVIGEEAGFSLDPMYTSFGLNDNNVIVGYKAAYDSIASSLSVIIGAVAGGNPSGGGLFGTTAIGYSAKAGSLCTSIGYMSTSINNSVSLGFLTNSAKNGIAIGSAASAGDETDTDFNLCAIAIGEGSITRESSIGIGISSGTENAVSAIAIGVSAKATELRSIGIGNSVECAGIDAIAIGTSAGGVFGAPAGEQSTAIGFSARGYGDGSVALGSSSRADDQSGISIGASISAGFGSIAIGSIAEAVTDSAIAIGTLSQSSTRVNSIAIGNESSSHGGIAIGYQADTFTTTPDYVNIAIGRSASSTWEGITLGSFSSAEEHQIIIGHTCAANTSVSNSDYQCFLGADDLLIGGSPAGLGVRPATGLILRGPSPTYSLWRLTVDNAGVLSTSPA